MEADLNERLKKVVSWLKKIYGVQYMPVFEVNARTIYFLYELVVCNEAADKDASLLIEDMKERARQYEAQSKYLIKVLTESLRLSPCSLSRKGKHYLEVLVDSAMTLETKDTSLVSLFCAINGLTLEIYHTETKNEELASELRRMRNKLTAVLLLEQRLKEDLEKTKKQLEVSKAKADSRAQNLRFLRNKSEDLKIRIKDAERKLIAVGLDHSVMHHSLILLSEKLAAIKEEVKSVKSELKDLLDLPLNISLAKVKIEEVKRELDTVEAELTKEIDKLDFELL